MITSNGGGDFGVVSIAEGQTVVTQVAASGAAGVTITYAITGGADATRFSINPVTGQLNFVTAPDFEAPDDSDGDNLYEVIVSASDGSVTDSQTLNVSVGDRSVAARLIAPDGFAGGIGGTTAVFLTSGFQDIEILDAPGTITLSGAPGGDDIIRFAGDASRYTITRVGSRVEIADGDTQVSIPVSPTGINVVFADGPRTLALVDGQLRIGGQVATTAAAVITAPAEPGPLPDLADPDARGRLIVGEDSPVIVDGNVDVFGTSFDAETFTITGGDVAIRGGFTGGNDTIGFDQPASAFTAVRVGSIVIIEGGDTRVSIPVSPGGVILLFGSDQRLLRIDTDTGEIVLDDLVITNTPQQLGAPDTNPVIDLADLDGSLGFVIPGLEAGDLAGRSVSSGGDVNGDGFDDLIIGAYGADPDGKSFAGTSYVVFGKAGGFGTSFDLASLDGSNGFAIAGIDAFDNSGFSVSAAGDLNGDGLADLIIGAPGGDPSGSASGESYVVFGRAGGFGPSLDLASLNGVDGFRIDGIGSGDESGFAVSSAGDVNGDGFDDLLIGAYRADADGKLVAGESYVVFGKANGFGASVDLANLNGATGFRIDGIAVGDQSGFSVSAAGDVNGDGIDDLVIGAPEASSGAGAAYVLFGKTSGFGASLDLASLNGSNGFALTGIAAGDNAGFAVSSVGDLNGDGFDDLVVGAIFADGTAGASYVVFGSGTGFAPSLDLASLNGTNGFRLGGIDTGDQAGFAVSAAGDLNGDGFDDLVIGARYGDPAVTNAGEAYVVLGKAGGFGANLDLTGLDGSNGFRIDGIALRDQSGFDVASAGDLDGDGFDDLVIGAPFADVGSAADAGQSYVIHGGNTGTEVTVSVRKAGTAGTDLFTGKAGNDSFTKIGAGDVVRGGAGDDRIGVKATSFADIRGGHGFDTLGLDGAGLTLDLTTKPGPKLDSIEAIDLTGTGNNRLIVDEQSIARLTDARSNGTSTLIVMGNQGDQIDAIDFVRAGTEVIDGVTYNVFEQGNARLLAEVGVAVTVNNPPVIVSGATATALENQTSAYIALATDAEGDAVTFSLSGTDAALFNIDSATGVVTFKTAPNFEAPSDSNGDNQYQIVVTATDGEDSTAQAVTISVANVNEAPTVTSGAAATVNENQTAAYTATATDPDAGTTLSYSLSGADAALFDISAAGVVTFKTAPNFEAPADAGADNQYNFVVTASDGTLSDDQAVAITVANVNEAPTAVALNNPLATRAENSPSVAAIKVADIAITDDALGTETITLSGADAAFFEVVGSELRLKAGTALNFEAKSSYNVTVNVADPSLPGSTPVTANYTLTVTDVNEAPTAVALNNQVTTRAENSPSVAAVKVADIAITDDALGTETITLTGADAAFFEVAGSELRLKAGTALNFEAKSTYSVTVNVADLSLPGSTPVTANYTLTVTDVNEAPTVTSGATATVNENQTAAYTATATDPDAGATLSYSLSGTDAALFNIDSSTGVVTFKSAPNFEAPADAGANNQYNLIVTASDGTLSDDQAVAITVANVNEAPTVTSAATATVDENLTAAYTATATDPDAGTTLTYSLSGTDAALFNIDSSTGAVTFLAAPDFEAPADATGDNQYQITVRATDGGGLFDDQAVTVTVADVNEAFELSALNGTNGFVINGINADDVSGSRVSFAGDINGDGFDDVIIGASGADPNGISVAGSSFVVFGKASGFDASLDLDSLNGVNGFRINGTGGRSGVSVASAGDVNGDGFDDLIIGANYADANGRTEPGQSYVVFGQAGGFGPTLELSSLNGSNGFAINGVNASDRSGISVDSAGDVNGDGFDDLIIGAFFADPSGNNSGASYVVFGKASGFGASLNLASLDGTSGFVLNGINAEDRSGISVSSAGDVNGDGFGDVIVASIFADPNGNSSGQSYLLFGKSGGFAASLNLSVLDGNNGFSISGVDAGDNSGNSVSSAGDVNGDGFDDIIIGASLANPNSITSGASYVVFGKASGFGANLNLSTLNGSNGFAIFGISEFDRSGRSVSSAGDVNGDGFSDLIIGAYLADPNGSASGQSYVVFGKASGFAASLDLAALDPSSGFAINGIDAGDFSGRSVSAAGDINGDGFDDLIIGADGGTPNNVSDAGESYVIFGGATGTEDTAPVTRTGTVAADNFTGNAGNDTFTGIAAGDVVRGGTGNDSIAITTTTFADISGGRGTDTLVLAGAGLILDLTTTPRPRLDSIEVIDLTGTGNNSLTVSELGIYQLTEQRSGGEATLIVNGNAGDSVDAQDFIVSGTQIVGGVTYNLFEKGNANLLVAQGVTVTGVNNRPVANDDSGTASEDSALVVTAASTTLGASGLLTNDTDLDSDPLSITAVNGVAASVGTQITLASGALLTVNANGSYTYNPNGQFEALGFGATDTDSFTYTISDGTLTDTATVSITINGVNDAPTVANPIANQAFDEDTAVSFTVPANAFADIDSATLTYSAELSNGTALPSWLSFDPGTRAFSGTPPLNFNGVLEIELTASDGTLTASDLFNLTITPVNDAPNAPDGAITTDEDTSLFVSGTLSLLGAVTDPDGPSLAVTQINGASFTFGSAVTLASGALLVVQSNGSYLYSPNGQFEALRPGETDSDSFTFTVSDGSLTDTATVTITIEGRNEVPIAGTDTLSMTGNTPITITGASLLTNDSDPDGTPTTAITLKTVGGASNGTVDLNDDGTITFTPTTGYTGPASFTYTIEDADGATATGTVNVTVDGLVWYVDNSYAGTNGTSDGSYLRPFTQLTGLNGGTGDGTTDDDVDGTGQTIFVANTGTAYTGGITLEEGQKLFGDGHEFTVNGIDIGGGVTTNTSVNHSSYGVTLSTGNEIRGINFSGTSATAVGIQDGDGTVGNLTIAGVSVSGTGKALDIDQGGTLAVSFDTLSSTNSSTEGVHLQGVSGTFAASSGAIAGSTNQGFLIGAAGGGSAGSGGNATITYGGSIANSGSAAVEIQDRTGGTVTLSGGITETAGQGIVADGNAGTLNFGGQIAISSGASTAVSLTNNSAAMNFTPTGNGLDITTTTGNGFIVDGGGGTVTLSGTGNTVTTTSGRAVEIDGVTIGTGGVNFQSVTITDGTATTGIFLRNAGSGGFTITGTASTAGSGGTINSIDGGGNVTAEEGIGIFIENASNISLSNMNFTGNFGNFGIRGNTVNNFTLRDSTFNATDFDDGGFGDSSDNDEGVIRFTGLTGTALFEGNNISDGHEDVLRIDNSSGTLNLTVRDSTSDQAVIGRNGTGVDSSGNVIAGTATGNDGIIVNGSGTSNITVLIDGVEFNGSRGDLIQTEANGSATQNVTIRNNTFANLHPDITSGGGGMTVGLSGGTGAGPGVTYNIESNTFTGAEGTVILTQASGPVGTMSGTILNNVIGTPSGGYTSAQATTGTNGFGNGIEARVEKSSGSSNLTHAVRIEGNTIRDVDGTAAIFLRSNGAADASGTARLEATVVNNTIAELGPNAFSGIYAQLGGDPGSDGLLGLNVRGNTVNMTGATTAFAAFVFDDEPASAAQFYLPGYAGTFTETELANFLAAAPQNNTITVLSPVEAVGFAPATAGPSVSGSNFVLPVPLMVEPGLALGGSGVEATLSAVEALREAAVQLWFDAGASEAQIAAMRAVKLSVADLFGGFLGQTGPDGIVIDRDAAGNGWFIDTTPLANEEFSLGAGGLTALAGSEAAQGIDLLTAIAHELGHVVGLDDLYGNAAGVMEGFLALGERNLPDAVTPSADGGSGGDAGTPVGSIGSYVRQLLSGGFDIDTLLHGIGAAGDMATSVAERVANSTWDNLGLLHPIDQIQIQLVVDVPVL